MEALLGAKKKMVTEACPTERYTAVSRILHRVSRKGDIVCGEMSRTQFLK